MRLTRILIATMLVIALLPFSGCVRAAKDTTGFAQEQSLNVNAPFEQTWQAVKTVLREQDLELYTRDKRGVFVAYTPMKRSLVTPKRTQYTIELSELSSSETSVFIETVNQVYGVTLLTYPGWHDRPAKNTEGAQNILSAIQAKISGEAPAAAPAPANS